MSSGATARELRRSTRIRLKVVIEVDGISQPLHCEGETNTVNLHGALILAAIQLRVGMKIQIQVLATGERADADVVYVDPEQPRYCGIALRKARNIWGVSLPPEDWVQNSSDEHSPQ